VSFRDERYTPVLSMDERGTPGCPRGERGNFVRSRDETGTPVCGRDARGNLARSRDETGNPVCGRDARGNPVNCGFGTARGCFTDVLLHNSTNDHQEHAKEPCQLCKDGPDGLGAVILRFHGVSSLH
jgi:hypothetical protein